MECPREVAHLGRPSCPHDVNQCFVSQLLVVRPLLQAVGRMGSHVGKLHIQVPPDSRPLAGFVECAECIHYRSVGMRAGSQFVELQVVEILHLFVRDADHACFVVSVPPSVHFFAQRCRALRDGPADFCLGFGQRYSRFRHLVHGCHIKCCPVLSGRFFPVGRIVTPCKKRVYAPAFVLAGYALRRRIVGIVQLLLLVGEYDDAGRTGASRELFP